MKTYNKPAMTTSEHISQWKERGLSFADEVQANHYLSHISYYRLSAYAIPFTQPHSNAHQFKTGTQFEDILALYVFDRELRLLIMDAIERIEVAVRAHLCNYMSTKYNTAFWYMDEQHFKVEYGHKRLLADLERQLSEERQRLERDERSIDKRPMTPLQKQQLKDKVQKENFLRHYLCVYDAPRMPPCWMMVELLSMGSLSHLYAGRLKTADKKAIASKLGTHAELLESWLKSLNTIRNYCAHHSRLWNRELGASIKIPTSQQVKWLQQPVVLGANIRYEKRLYPVLVALQSLLYSISPSATWATRLKTLLDNNPTLMLTHMGIPANWHLDPFWQPTLQPDLDA